MKTAKNQRKTPAPQKNRADSMSPPSTGCRRFTDTDRNGHKKDFGKDQNSIKRFDETRGTKTVYIETSADQLKWLRITAGLSRREAAEFMGVSLTHVQRLERGAVPVREVHKRMMRLAAGELGDLSPKLDGWRIHGGQIISPEQDAYNVGALRAVPWNLALIKTLQGELREIRELVAQVQAENRQLKEAAEPAEPARRPALRSV